MILLDVATFSGHLHPLVVHLPIGFILLAFVFDIMAYKARYRHLKEAVGITLLFGFVSAVLACLFGYILSLTGDYDIGTLTQHKVSGISLALICGILYSGTLQYVKDRITIPRKFFSGLLTGIILLLCYSGHQGASLTHGNSYLTMQTLLQQKRQKPVTVNQAMLYEDVIHPILLQKCAQCHRDGKMKGELSVETVTALLKGGKTGPAIVAGRPDVSELYKRITLDAGHQDFMPADGNTPLGKKEMQLIKWWIAQGAEQGKPIASLKHTEEIRPLIKAYLGLDGAEANPDENMTEQVLNADIPATVDTSVINELRKSGLMVRIMLRKPVMLDITMPAQMGIKPVVAEKGLLKLAKNIIWLNLSDNQFTDNDLGFLAALANLEKLRLDKNPVTDDVSRHLLGLKHLESVTLNETNTTIAGIEAFKKKTGIKRVYTWNIAATHSSAR